MKTIYKLYDLKFVSCTKKEFDNLLTNEIRDDCAYIINDEGKITIHLNSSENRLKEIIDLVNTKQDYFADVYIPSSRATSIVTASTPNLQIYSKDLSSALMLEQHTASLDISEGTKFSIDQDCAKFYTTSKHMAPVFGVATPMSKQQLDSMSYATADDEPYQAANKKYVDDSRLYVTTF